MAGTWTVVEVKDSRDWHYASPGVESLLTLVYLVQWKPNAPGDVYPGDGAIRTLSGLPRVRQRVPAAVYGSDAFLKRFVVRSVEPTIDTAAPYSWRVHVTAGTLAQPDETDFALVTRNSVARQVAIYRMGATLPTDGAAAWPATTDIAGTKVDMNGNPRAFDVPQQEITVETFWDRTLARYSSGTSGEPPWATWSGYQFTRNDAALLGCAKGSLLYRGWTVAPYFEWYRIQHHFVFDAWYHLEQVPVPIPTGQPLCTLGATVCGVVVLQADKIGWMQRYQTLATHASILSTAQLLELTDPVPAWIP